jgi:hypothetical protein
LTFVHERAPNIEVLTLTVRQVVDPMTAVVDVSGLIVLDTVPVALVVLPHALEDQEVRKIQLPESLARAVDDVARVQRRYLGVIKVPFAGGLGIAVFHSGLAVDALFKLKKK